jgi:ABC-type cobalamin/Fe3+-siderophores transport system ATPase subunit
MNGKIPSINFVSGNAVHKILAYLMLSCGTGMMLLANPASHFSLQKQINIMRHFLHRCGRLLP